MIKIYQYSSNLLYDCILILITTDPNWPVVFYSLRVMCRWLPLAIKWPCWHSRLSQLIINNLTSVHCNWPLWSLTIAPMNTPDNYGTVNTIYSILYLNLYFTTTVHYILARYISLVYWSTTLYSVQCTLCILVLSNFYIDHRDHSWPYQMIVTHYYYTS